MEFYNYKGDKNNNIFKHFIPVIKFGLTCYSLKYMNSLHAINFFRSNLYYPNKLYLSSLSFAKDYLNTSCPRTTPISSPQGH